MVDLLFVSSVAYCENLGVTRQNLGITSVFSSTFRVLGLLVLEEGNPTPLIVPELC